MSIKTSITTISTNNYSELEELSNNLEEKMLTFSKDHPDFSVVIEKHIDTNEVVIKTLFLQEHIN